MLRDGNLGTVTWGLAVAQWIEELAWDVHARTTNPLCLYQNL
jgi:hypothetical protein